ncbi:site-specific integrase [Mycobacterium sp. 1465703.0]|uniref:tyrosine-type recombinase/integrase n=1 Tax=Mycobacterium sp. 1465703.0 TaxID=1834078 RepID=UPI0009F6C599|nr:site-specific integrase [Mycobacterium sp. 1465703.0]
MEQPRGQRQGVENLWVSRSGQRTKLYNKGMQYRARYVDSSGKEHTRRFRYKAEANEWLKQITRGGMDIAPPVSGEWTVAQQFSRWIRKADIAETTRATRQHTWRAHVADKWGDLQVTKVLPPDIKAWVADLVDARLGVPTIENALGVLRMVLKDSVDDGRLIRNPCDGINAPRRQHRSRAYLTHQQVEELALAAGENHGLVIRLLAYTGLRWGELAALSVGSVDMLRRRLQITQAVAEADGRLNWKSPKDHERRSVPFPLFLVGDLGEHMLGKGREDLLFASSNGGALRVSHWRPRVFNVARDSPKEFPKVTPNDLRHTAASLAVSAGGNVLALARMLGHEDPSLTLRTYADLFDSDLDALADVLDQHRTAALQPSTANSNSETDEKNVPSTLQQTA